MCFFNQGHSMCTEFIPRGTRQNMFWFHDSFYSHVSIDKQDRYLHIFVRNPSTENFSFETRQGFQDFEEMYYFFKENKEKLHAAYHKKIGFPIALNPPILFSYDTFIPDLILDFKVWGANVAEIIFPEKYRGIHCRLFDETHIPIPFIEIPEIVNILPQIKEAYPCI